MGFPGVPPVTGLEPYLEARGSDKIGAQPAVVQGYHHVADEDDLLARVVLESQ